MSEKRSATRKHQKVNSHIVFYDLKQKPYVVHHSINIYSKAIILLTIVDLKLYLKNGKVASKTGVV